MDNKKKESVAKDLFPAKITFNQALIKWGTFVLMTLLFIYILVLVIIIFATNVAIYDEVMNTYTILGEILIGMGVVLGVFLIIDIIIICLIDNEKKLREEFFIAAIAPLSESPKNLDNMEINIGENLTKKQYRRNTKTKVFTAFATLGIGLIVVGFATGFIILDNFQKPIPTKYIKTADMSDAEHKTEPGTTMIGFTDEFATDWQSHKWNTLSIPYWVHAFEWDTVGDNSFSALFDSIDETGELNKSITNIKMSDEITLTGDYEDAFHEDLFRGSNFKNAIVLPSSIKKIGQYCFEGNEYASSITFGSKLEQISVYAFKNFGSKNNNIKNIVRIPGSIKTIQPEAFLNYGDARTSKTNIEFSDCSNLTLLGNGCFDMYHGSDELNVYMPKLNKTKFTNWLPIFGDDLSHHKTIKLHLPSSFAGDEDIIGANIGIGGNCVYTNL